MPEPPIPTLIYNFQFTEKLASILTVGALLCYNQRPPNTTSNAYDDLQDRRDRKPVGCGPGGTLHDYVPFYFAPRSPMMFTLAKGNVPGYLGDTHEMVYFVSSVQRVQELGLPFVFTDGHGIMRLSNFYADPDDLAKLDWNVLRSSIWRNTEEDNDRRRRRMAEFLVWQHVPLGAFTLLATHSAKRAKQVARLLQEYGIRLPVRAQPKWYY